MKKLLTLFMFISFISMNAQWEWNTDINLLVADSNSGDMKAISTSDGNTYVVFWKVVAAPINYELRMQVLDSSGNKTLGDDGILISDQIPMSTFTYIWNINIDENDNLYIGVTGSGGGEPAYVFKLDTSGNHLWGTNGINVGSGFSVNFLSLSDGKTIVSWYPGTEGLMQKFDGSGNAIWGATQPIEEGGSDTVPANMFEMSNGDYIMVFHSLTFGINSNLFAQRYNSLGESQWANPTQLSSYGTVFNRDYSGLQDGDIVYMGYSASPGTRFDSFLQRLNPDGTLPWGVNGSDFDVSTDDYEMNTEIAFLPGFNDIYAICTYSNTSQSEKGEYQQRFNKITGERFLTDNATVVFPIGSEKVHAGKLIVDGDGLPSFMMKNGLDNGVTPTTIDFVELHNITPEEYPMATFTANKSRIHHTYYPFYSHIVVFIEDKGDGEKIYVQHIENTIISVEDHGFINNNISFNNPVINNLSISSEKNLSSIKVISMIGQVISEASVSNNTEIDLDTSSWNSGLYFVTIETSEGDKGQIKVIKK